MIADLIAPALLLLVAWFCLCTLKAREIGVESARNACMAEGLQFLDETVALSGIRVRRNDKGHVCLQRSYSFEFSVTGNDRHGGSVTLLGYEVVMLDTGPHRVETDSGQNELPMLPH